MTTPTSSTPLPTLGLRDNTEDRPVSSIDQPIRKVLDQKQLLAWANTTYAQMKSARTNVERQWYLNLAFVFGKQNVQFASSVSSATGFKLGVPPAPPWKKRLVINKIRPMVRKTVAKIVSQKPRFTVVPASTDDEDYNAARAAEQIFDSLYSRKHIQRVVRKATWWNVVCGVAYIKNYWDATAMDTDAGKQGDIMFEHITPFHVLVPDLKEEDLEAQPFIFHISTKSSTWAKMNFPDRNFNSTVRAADDILSDSFLNIIGGKSNVVDSILCMEIWIKPGGHKDFPAGGMVTVVGGQITQIVDGFPYKHGMYPFAKLENIPSGRFYAESVITDQISLQREYNRTRSQIVEAKDRMGKPQMMAQKGSVDVQKITTEPGQYILVNPGYQMPQAVPLTPLPNYIIQELQQLQQDMDDMSGQHDISRGQNPSQVTAASALSFLAEQDDSMLSDTIENLEECIEKIGKMSLWYVTQFWNTERLVKTVGTDGSFDALVFKAGMLKKNQDLRVESGSALPTSKAAKLAVVMDLIKMGPASGIDPGKALELIEIGGIEKIFDDVNVDIRQAQRENIKMSQGLELMPNDYDNHQVHIEYHNKFRKQQQFEILPDEIKQLFEQHVSMHQSGQTQQGMQAAQQQGQAQALAGGASQEQPPVGADPNAQPLPGDSGASMGAPADASSQMAGQTPLDPANMGAQQLQPPPSQ